jgi:ABC-2 type transport system permease protein
MPSSVDEVLDLGFYAPVLPTALEQAESEGLELNQVDSVDALREAVTDGEIQAGIAIPEDISESLANGENAQVEVFFPSDAPGEVRDIITTMVRELFFLQSGQALNIEVTEEILGIDLAGMQIAPRDRMLPLFAVMLILVETIGLASLISEEVINNTLAAILITPVTVTGLFVAKGTMGISLAFSQAVLLLAITGGLSQQPLILLVALLLGAGLATSIAFLVASLGKDLMSVMAWGVPVLLLLMIPAFAILLPGLTTNWIKVIPSYYLVNPVHLAANFGLGWSQIWQDLAILLAFDIVFFGLGIWAIRRKIL